MACILALMTLLAIGGLVQGFERATKDQAGSIHRFTVDAPVGEPSGIRIKIVNERLFQDTADMLCIFGIKMFE